MVPPPIAVRIGRHGRLPAPCQRAARVKAAEPRPLLHHIVVRRCLRKIVRFAVLLPAVAALEAGELA